MLYRKLGHTGYDLSVIGFGTWQLGGKRWQFMSDTDSIKLLHEANDLGVNIYDAAAIYGQYKSDTGYLESISQERLGKAFANRRDKVIYCIKLGQFDEVTHRHDYDPKRVIDQFQHSLRRLKTDFIDICLIHAPSIAEVKNGKAIAVLQTLQALGYVKSIGYSFEAEPEHAIEAIKQPIDVIMLQYNLIDSECARAIELARQHGIGILAGGPYKRGYLTGEYRDITQLPIEDDYWNLNVRLNPGKVKHILEKVNVHLDRYQTPRNLRQANLAHILQQEGIASCIVGHRNINEVLENIELTETKKAVVKAAPKLVVAN